MNIRQVTRLPVAGVPGYAGPALQISALALPPMVSIAIVVMAKMLFMLFMLNTPILKQHIRNVRVKRRIAPITGATPWPPRLS